MDAAYVQSDDDRRMLERSLDLSSQELLDANTDLRAVMESLLDLFFRLDHEGVILDFRVGSNGSLLFPDLDLVGRPIQAVPQPEVARIFTEALTSLRATGQATSVEYSLLIDQRDLEHFTAHLLPLRHGQIAVAVQNVTGAREAERRERELRDQLAQAQRMESLGLLAGGVAHDLNNILGPLVAYPDLIRQEIGDHPTALEDLEAMKKAALRAASVIQDLLTMARRGVPTLVALDLNRCVQSVLDSPAVEAVRQRHPDTQLQVELDADLPLVAASESRLAQAILNLVLNAFEATSEGGTVRASTRRGEEEDIVVLAVSDDGCGIDAADLEHIFEPFYSKKKLGRSGSGLGLAVVWGVVQDLGGSVDVTSTPQRTRFTIALPRSPETNVEPRQPGRLVGGQERLLVVDDVAEQRVLAARLLESLGYRVVTVANGREALRQLEQQPFDLLVLDMVVEDHFDGLDIWRAARSRDPELRCVIASGYAESERITQAWAEGAGPRVQKPYTIADLGRAVRSELDRKAAPEPNEEETSD